MTETSTITEMDKATAERIGREIFAVVQAKAAELGVDVRFKGGTYDPAAGTLTDKFEFSIKPKANPGLERQKFERDVVALCGRPSDPEDYSWCWLRVEDYGRVVQFNGKDHEIIGVNLRRPKWRVALREVATGREVATTEDAIRRILGRPATHIRTISA